MQGFFDAGYSPSVMLPARILITLVCLLVTSQAPGESAVVSLHDGRVELVTDPALTTRDGNPWAAWIETLTGSVVSVVPGFPKSGVQVRLRPSSRRDPITYGRVQRRQRPVIDLQVHPEATLDALLDDWRGYHEFAHLLIPFPSNDDIWFSEGIASYYQHLLQVRAGVIEPDEAWQRLFAGFQRGLEDPVGKNMTLAELSPRMWRLRAYRRVYWTGAAYFLRVDLRLRTESGGIHSVDSVLAAFDRCCSRERQRWTAEALLHQFGQLSLPNVWLEEYERMIDSKATPDVGQAMQALGIEWAEDGVSLSGNPRQARLRRAIATGRGKRAGTGQ